MMLFKLSIANLKKSFKDYAIYFFTLILGVSIFYIFNSIESQTSMLTLSSSTHEMIGMIITLMDAVSIFVSMILGFLIIYASRFLIKKRNKEFGIYILLGMSKRKVSLLLLVETFLIGLISLFAGLALGVLLSQVTSVFIASMFEADMSSYTFNFSISAALKTMLYFTIIYLIVMLFNTGLISKLKLIDLLQASKKNEEIKLRNPMINIIIFILSIIDLAIAYYLVTGGLYTVLQNYQATVLFLPIGMGIVGTFMFFYSISGFLLKLMMKSKRLYYKGLNSFVIRQINSKVNTMIFSISMICLMMFVTICTFSSAFAIKDYSNTKINTLAPCDYEISYLASEKITIDDVLKEDDVDKNDVKDITTVTSYIDYDFTYGKSLGTYGDELREKYPNIMYDQQLADFITLSDYNKLAKVFHFEEMSLKDDEYGIFANYEAYMYDEFLSRKEDVEIFNTTLHPGINKTVEGYITMTGAASNLGIFVVPDSIVENQKAFQKYTILNYNTDDELKRKELDSKFFENYGLLTENGYSLTGRTPIKEESIGLSAMATFVGLFIGLTFMIACGAILALKELSDCLDDREKYRVLRKIGTDEKMIKSSIFKQTFIFFMLPLILAIIHSIFGIGFCYMILQSIGINNLLRPICITAAFILVIYGGYFYLTYLCKNNILRDIR